MKYLLFVALLGTLVRASDPAPASDSTRAHNAAVTAAYPFADHQDFEDANRGFLGTIPEGKVVAEDGRVVWNQSDYGFLATPDVPDTVNPSLWRIAQLNALHGLYQVTEHIFQVRGLDIANVTFVEGDRGVIVIDPLTYVESAKAALELYFKHRPRRPVVGVIYTHSHLDHFGGVKGVITEEAVKRGEIPVIAPSGFLEHAVSENVLAGPAMIRRASYQFGNYLPKNPRGHVDAGLGKSGFGGTPSLIAPTDLIRESVEKRVIDGVEIEFILAPETEAPAEMYLYFPQWRALNMAEIATHTLHNLLPLRGAEVRDSLAWAGYLQTALHRYGPRSDVVFAQHHWPVWGTERLSDYLSSQSDLYQFIHDQTLHWMAQGYNADEIANKITLPPTLEKVWATHGLYGSPKHNVRAVYQKYLGWYDGNPAHLDPLPPKERAARTVEYMGGVDAVLTRAKADFAKGDYRWVVQVLEPVIWVAPENHEARELAAQAHEQLGYQAESATWRNAYLQAAAELRNGPPKTIAAAFSAELSKGLSANNLFDALASRVDAAKAEGKDIVVQWVVTDDNKRYTLALKNSVIHHYEAAEEAPFNVRLTLDHATLVKLLTKQIGLPGALLTGSVKLNGNPLALAELFGVLDAPATDFPIVTPK